MLFDPSDEPAPVEAQRAEDQIDRKPIGKVAAAALALAVAMALWIVIYVAVLFAT